MITRAYFLRFSFFRDPLRNTDSTTYKKTGSATYSSKRVEEQLEYYVTFPYMCKIIFLVFNNVAKQIILSKQSIFALGIFAKAILSKQGIFSDQSDLHTLFSDTVTRKKYFDPQETDRKSSTD